MSLNSASKSVVDETVGTQGLAAGDLKWTAGKISDTPAGFLHKQHAGSGIPRIEIELPETVEASRGYIAEIERSRAGAAHTVRAQRDLVIEVNVRILVAFVAGKPSCNQRFLKARRGRDVDGFSVQARAAAFLRGKQFVAGRIVNHARYALTFVFDRQRHAEHRVAVREIGGAIERVDVPLVVTAGFNARSLFAHNIVRRELTANAREDQGLRFAVGDGDEIGIPFVFDLHVTAEMDHQKRAGFAGDRFHGREQRGGMVRSGLR